LLHLFSFVRVQGLLAFSQVSNDTALLRLEMAKSLILQPLDYFFFKEVEIGSHSDAVGGFRK